MAKYDSTGLYTGPEDSMMCSACGTIFEVAHSEAECFATRFRVLVRPLEQQIFELTLLVGDQATRLKRLEAGRDDGK